MGTTIFYFTGTGNSLMISRDLAKELGNTRVISIARATQDMKIDLSDDCIGFVFPVYYQVMPVIVQDFIGKLPLDRSKYIFAVVSSGAFVGDALGQLAGILSQKGAGLAAGYQILLPYNYIINPLGLKVPGVSKQEKLFHEEKQKVKAIAETIKARNVIGVEKKPFILIRHLHPLSWSKKEKMALVLADKAKNFWANDKCKGCGRCQSLCPVDNIEMVDDRPVWRDHCQQCLACINWCPSQAIQYGKVTSDKERYTNPYVTIKNMINTVGKQNDVQ
jgi:ferredoxin